MGKRPNHFISQTRAEKMRPKNTGVTTNSSLKYIDFTEINRASNKYQKKEKRKKEVEERKEARQREKFNKEFFSAGSAFSVTLKDIPSLFYFTFAKNQQEARSKGYYFFKENRVPETFNLSCDEIWKRVNTKYHKELDKYSFEGKIPIPVLMQTLNLSFPCSNCMSVTFNYKDYENKKCYVIEGEGDLSEFTSGFILCPKCYHDYTH